MGINMGIVIAVNIITIGTAKYLQTKQRKGIECDLQRKVIFKEKELAIFDREGRVIENTPTVSIRGYYELSPIKVSDRVLEIHYENLKIKKTEWVKYCKCCQFIYAE